ncbi:MAG: hypothetical protein ACE5G2_00950 [Candidatus Krumholzibacteriia bacterium]
MSTCGLVLCTCLVLAATTRAGADEPLRIRFENGIDATLYSPEHILENMTVNRDGEMVLLMDDAEYHLVTRISDPVVTNKGDGRFHPMSVDAVIGALRDLRMDDTGLPMRVFILPYPRREVLDSSARDDMILLSPGVREVTDYAVHFTVTHEIGHIYQYRWLPDHDAYGWARYQELRGIGNRTVYHAGAIHRNRPHEMFAEDFRFLFGGPHSTYSGSIENPDLPLPSEVEGLEEFILALREPWRASAARLVPAPNPFNPSTEIQVEFVRDPGPWNVLVRVFDAHGRYVRRLFDGRTTLRLLKLPWDGRRDGGSPVASGVYFARLDYAGTHTTTKLMLVK